MNFFSVWLLGINRAYTPDDDDYEVIRYVYADKKGGFFFAAAGDWIIRQAAREQFPQTAVIPITKI